MGQSPFAKRPVSQEDLGLGRRRTTRIEYVAPVILAGRDAAGQTFREETKTSTVNLHGAKLATRHPVLVGMQVGIEVPQTGMVEKAICVWVGETPPEETAHDIAVQLLTPKNIWGVEDPPADWQEYEEAQRSRRPPTAAGVGAMRRPSVDLRLAEVEQQAARMLESAVWNLRSRIDEIVRAALQDFERRLQALLAGAEAQVRERADQAFAELESALATFRADVADELEARKEEALKSTQEALRSKLATMTAPLVPPSPGAPAAKSADPTAKK